MPNVTPSCSTGTLSGIKLKVVKGLRIFVFTCPSVKTGYSFIPVSLNRSSSLMFMSYFIMSFFRKLSSVPVECPSGHLTEGDSSSFPCFMTDIKFVVSFVCSSPTILNYISWVFSIIAYAIISCTAIIFRVGLLLD